MTEIWGRDSISNDTALRCGFLLLLLSVVRITAPGVLSGHHNVPNLSDAKQRQNADSPSAGPAPLRSPSITVAISAWPLYPLASVGRDLVARIWMASQPYALPNQFTFPSTVPPLILAI
jgi:hypothetical protein